MRRVSFQFVKSLTRSSKPLSQIRKFNVPTPTSKNEEKLVQLLFAASEGHFAVVKDVIAKKEVPVDKADYDFRTALHLAAAEGHFEIVKFLVENGAQVNAVDRWNRTPLEDALRGKHNQIIDYLIQKGGRTFMSEEEIANRLCIAAGEGELETIKLLVKAGANINAGNYDGRTALHSACAVGNQRVVEFLLQNGAKINSADNFGATPIQDAIKNKHHQLAKYLLSQGAEMPTGVSEIVQLPEFTSAVSKSVEVLCKNYGWDYGETWIPHRSNRFMTCTPSYYASPDYSHTAETVRSAAKELTYEKGVSIAGRVWESQQPEFVAKVTTNDLPNANINKAVSAVGIPIVHDNKLLAVMVFWSTKEINGQSIDLQQTTAFASRLVASGVPNLQPQLLKAKPKGQFVAKMDAVYEIVSNQGVFDNVVLFYETWRYFYEVGLPDSYFNHFSPNQIAKHLHSLVAAKKVALGTTGREDDIWLVNETEDSAYYMCPRDVKITVLLERKIDEYMSATPGTHGYSLEYFASKGPIIAGGSRRLSCYVVSRYKYGPKPEPGKKYQLTDVARKGFLHGRTPGALQRYEAVLSKAEGRLVPLLEKFPKEPNGVTPIMFAFHMARDSQSQQQAATYLERFSEVLLSVSGCECDLKFIETFSNGLVVYTLYVRAEKDSDIDVLLNKASMLAIIPKTPLNRLFTEGILSARQLIYVYSVMKFCYYFTNQQTDEYRMLVEALKNDPMNLGRLLRLQNRLKKDALTESRINECIMNNVDLIKDIYKDFYAIATGQKKPSVDEKLQHRIKRTVSDPLDTVILNSFLVFNSHLLKTNFYKQEKAAVAFRLDPSFLDSSYPAIPYGIFMVISNDFIGFHVRFSDVARGGIRIIKSGNTAAYHANAEELFTENYNLAYTQQKKNKDIPEGGSKGTVLLSPDHQQNGDIAFKKYIDAILDMLLLGPEIHDHYGKQEVLFMGPDENSAHLMDWACKHSKSRGYPFWKAFTTGKSVELGGIPHDTYGMTTNSVHQYCLGIYEKLGLDESQVTKAQTGGPDGDLGSNEILISKDKTIAVVDGSGVLYDPHGIDRTELLRLVKKRTMIKDFDTSKLSKDGFRVLVTDNDVKLPDGYVVESGINFRNTFHLNPLVKADIFVPCGGRPASINVSNVHKLFDKDGVPRFKYIVEGANLFLTQDARLVLEKAGVILYKDASTNKGGVTSSSLEVLAALCFSNEEFEKLMQVKDGVIPEFYKQYVEEVLEKIRRNARLEFECIWNEHLRTGIPRAQLTDEISAKINKLHDSIKDSSLWNDKTFVNRVMQEALPKLLVDKLGLETIMKRVPESYLRAIFGAHLASTYVYKYGMDASEFHFYEFMKQYSQDKKQ